MKSRKQIYGGIKMSKALLRDFKELGILLTMPVNNQTSLEKKKTTLQNSLSLEKKSRKNSVMNYKDLWRDDV